MEKRLEPPFVLKEIDDPELMYFESHDDMLSDRFDILWDDEFEGWDARGRYFRLERRYPKQKWWQLLLNVDASYLELVSVGHSLIDIKHALEKDLDIVYSSPSQQRFMLTVVARWMFTVRREQVASEKRNKELLRWSCQKTG